MVGPLTFDCRLPVIAAASLVLAGGCQPSTSDWPRVTPSVPAPDFTLPTLDGGTVTLADQRGRVVIMEFWATWCPPCRYSTPSLEAIHRRYRNRGVTVLLINAGESVERIKAWAERRFTAPILLDEEGQVAQLYQVSGVPQLFVVDQDGQIVYDRSGYRGGLEHNLKVILNELLGEG